MVKDKDRDQRFEMEISVLFPNSFFVCLLNVLRCIYAIKIILDDFVKLVVVDLIIISTRARDRFDSLTRDLPV